jgi:hypothetical protein
MPDDPKRMRAERTTPKRLPRFAKVLAAMFVAPGATAFLPCAASADDVRSVVFVAEGPEGDVIASRVASRLPPHYASVDARAFRASLARGAPAPLTGALKSRRADAELVTRARAVGIDAHVDLAVLVQVRRSKGAQQLVHVWVIDAHQADAAAVDRDVPIAPGSSVDDTAGSTWGAIESAFPAEVPAPASTPLSAASTSSASGPVAVPAGGSEEPARGADMAEADATPPVASGGGPSLLRLGVALQGGSRHFAYVDRLTPTLRPYDLFMAPLVAIRADFDPFFRSRAALLNGLGVTGEYARAFGLSSADAGGARSSTSWQNFRVDVRDRTRLGDAVFAGLHAGFGAIDFSFDDALGPQAELPGVAYRFVRAGADGQGALGDLRLYGAASYLVPLSTGAVGDLFPRTKVGGVEARVGLGRSIARAFDLSLELVYTRFFYTLRPEPGDSFVAGGALDEMACVSLGLTYGFSGPP